MSGGTRMSPENYDRFIELGLNIAFYRKLAGMKKEGGVSLR